MARVAVAGDDEAALDIVQDTMLAFVRRYAAKGRDEWPPLFHRVLQNTIRDWYRRQKVRNRCRGWLSHFIGHGDDAKEADPYARVVDNANPGPEKAVEQRDAMATLEIGLQKLPRRQQQAFLLRIWEGLSIIETAAAMQCSAGSVKSHYFRALTFLRQELEGHWP
jgi:RNA polymerase sigma-70 factor (ECF subfamily)